MATVPVILTPDGALLNMGGVYDVTVIASNEVGSTSEWKQLSIGESELFIHAYIACSLSLSLSLCLPPSLSLSPVDYPTVLDVSTIQSIEVNNNITGMHYPL